MQLVADWRRVLRRAWSIRLNILLAALSGLDGAVSFAVDGSVSAALLVFAVSAGAAIARVIAQPGYPKDPA